MHWQHNGASCGKRQLLRNDRGRYLPWSFNKRSKRKGKSPCRKGREPKKKIKKKNHCIFRCLCLHHPWPLLHRSQGSVIAQTSCKVRCLYGGMFIAGVGFFWGSCEMTPGGFFPLRLCMTQIWQSSTGLLESFQAGSNPRIPAGPGVFKLIAPGEKGGGRGRKAVL